MSELKGKVVKLNTELNFGFVEFETEEDEDQLYFILDPGVDIKVGSEVTFTKAPHASDKDRHVATNVKLKK